MSSFSVSQATPSERALALFNQATHEGADVNIGGLADTVAQQLPTLGLSKPEEVEVLKALVALVSDRWEPGAVQEFCRVAGETFGPGLAECFVPPQSKGALGSGKEKPKDSGPPQGISGALELLQPEAPLRTQSTLHELRTGNPMQQRALSYALLFSSVQDGVNQARTAYGNQQMARLQQLLNSGQASAETVKQICPGVSDEVAQLVALMGNDVLNAPSEDGRLHREVLCELAGAALPEQNALRQLMLTANDACGQTATNFRNLFLGNDLGGQLWQTHQAYARDDDAPEMHTLDGPPPMTQGKGPELLDAFLMSLANQRESTYVQIQLDGHEFCLEVLPSNDGSVRGFQHQSWIGRFDETQWARESGSNPIDLRAFVGNLTTVFDAGAEPGARAQAYDQLFRTSGQNSQPGQERGQLNELGVHRGGVVFTAVSYDPAQAQARLEQAQVRAQAFFAQRPQ